MTYTDLTRCLYTCYCMREYNASKLLGMLHREVCDSMFRPPFYFSHDLQFQNYGQEPKQLFTRGGGGG